MKMRELSVDQEGLRRPGRFLRCQDQRPSARNGYAARLLYYAGQGEDTTRKFLHPGQVGRLLIELCVRIGRRGARPIAKAHW
jgi:hypothetical protein